MQTYIKYTCRLTGLRPDQLWPRLTWPQVDMKAIDMKAINKMHKLKGWKNCRILLIGKICGANIHIKWQHFPSKTIIQMRSEHKEYKCLHHDRKYRSVNPKLYFFHWKYKLDHIAISVFHVFGNLQHLIYKSVHYWCYTSMLQSLPWWRKDIFYCEFKSNFTGTFVMSGNGGQIAIRCTCMYIDDRGTV